MKQEYRLEQDSMGTVEVPAGARYGAQTQRALNNFTITSEPLPAAFIEALLLIKQAAATTNGRLGLLEPETADTIAMVARELLQADFRKLFPVPIFQTGSGTSTNMNVNEVICSFVRERGLEVSPNDHVNRGQSSNDVIPSAIHVAAALGFKNRLIPAVGQLSLTIREVAARHDSVIKTGRTHLMDALPIRLADEMNGWAAQLDEALERFTSVLSRLCLLPLGGTAVGTGVNCDPSFPDQANREISRLTGLDFKRAPSFFKGLSSGDTALEASSHLKTTACSLIKIANDLRLMNSGPLAGLGEIKLPSLQPGSSIMPDKVNPVIPEAVAMAAAQVIGNDAAITVAAQAGNFQLNTMLPLIGARLLDSIELISGAAKVLGEKAIGEMEINIRRMREPLEKNPVLVTALAPLIGYLQAAAIAKKARHQNRTILEVATEETDLEEQQLRQLLDPENLARNPETR